MPGVVVDGNDVLAVRAAAQAAVGRARAGLGPTLLECTTLRGPAHALRDALPADTRNADEVRAWADRDPVRGFARRVVATGTLGEDDLSALRGSVEAQLDAAVLAAEASPYPEPEEALEDLFSDDVRSRV